MREQESMSAVTTDTLIDVAQDKAVKKVLRDMFADIQPRLGEERTDLEEIFTPESAAELLQRLTDFSALLSVEDSYQGTLNKFQSQIDKAEKIRDEVLAKLFGPPPGAPGSTVPAAPVPTAAAAGGGGLRLVGEAGGTSS